MGNMIKMKLPVFGLIISLTIIIVVLLIMVQCTVKSMISDLLQKLTSVDHFFLVKCFLKPFRACSFILALLSRHNCIILEKISKTDTYIVFSAIFLA